MIGSCKGCARMREPGRGLVGGSTSSAHWVVRGVIGSRFSRLTDGQARTGDLCYRGGVVSKPAAPDEVVLSKGLSTAMDMDGYGVEERAVRKSMLPDEDAEPTSGVGPAGPGGGRAVEHPRDVQQTLRRHRWGGSRPRAGAYYQDYLRRLRFSGTLGRTPTTLVKRLSAGDPKSWRAQQL